MLNWRGLIWLDSQRLVPGMEAFEAYLEPCILCLRLIYDALSGVSGDTFQCVSNKYEKDLDF